METASNAVCTYCLTAQSPDFKFCASCGKRNSEIIRRDEHAEEVYKRNLAFLSFYAVSSIVLLIIAALTDDTFEVLLIWTICFAVIDVGFAIPQPSVWKLFRLHEIRLLPLAAIIAICISSGFIVTWSMDYLHMILYSETLESSYLFAHLDHPMLINIVLMAVCPAIFEELAFRGFVFYNLEVVAGRNSAIWGSAFLFGLVHLSLLSLIWIFPFGLLLAHFRTRYSTLIYGIIGHFVHNTTTILIEYYGLL